MGDHGHNAVQEAPKSAFGFRNIRAKTRSERRGMKDKVALERSRIMQRAGWEARMHQKNAPETTAGLTMCRPGDEGYMSNADRFHSDTVGEAYKERQEESVKKHAAHNFRRENARRRDEGRWEKTEQQQHLEEERIQNIREDPNLVAYRGPRKNSSLVAYDITNLQYRQDTTGEAQQYHDNMVRYRAQQRTRALVVLGDSRVPYNILTGDGRELPPKAQPVERPACLDDPELMGRRTVGGPHGGGGGGGAHVDQRKMLNPEMQMGAPGDGSGGGGTENVFPLSGRR